MDIKDLNNRFTYHKPKNDEQTRRYENIRGQALNMALNLNLACPESREKSLAITHLEEVVFWANAAIARNET